MKSLFRVLIFLFVIIFSIFSIQTHILTASLANNDIVITRNGYVLRFVNGGPDVTFYNSIDANNSQSKYRYTIQWNTLVEFTDNYHNGVYDIGSDKIF